MSPSGAVETNATTILYDVRQVNFGRLGLIVATTWVLILLVQRLLPWVADRVPGRFRFYILPLVPLLRLILIFGAVIEITPLIIKPTPQNLLAVLGAAGLTLGFAFKDYIGSLLAGVVAIYERPYRPGDWVKIDDTYGEVKALGLRSLKVVTPDDTVVTIPHAKIWTTNIANANDGKREHLCVADFYLHPAHDAHRVRRKLREVALTSSYLQLERPIDVTVSERPWGTHYRLKAYPIDGRDQFQFVSDLTIRAKAALDTIGVQPALAPAAVSLAPHGG